MHRGIKDFQEQESVSDILYGSVATVKSGRHNIWLRSDYTALVWSSFSPLCTQTVRNQTI